MNSVNYISLEEQLERFWAVEDLHNKTSEDMGLSKEDSQLIKFWQEKTVHLADQHYQILIPVKSTINRLQNNKPVAEHRLSLLTKKLLRDQSLQEKYVTGMQEMVDK